VVKIANGIVRKITPLRGSKGRRRVGTSPPWTKDDSPLSQKSNAPLAKAREFAACSIQSQK
jgi:hypothetical protein